MDQFLTYLKKQTKRDDPVGDLASDFIRENIRQNYQDIYDLYNHICTISHAVKALKSAWSEFSTEPFPIGKEDQSVDDGTEACDLHDDFDCEDCNL